MELHNADETQSHQSRIKVSVAAAGRSPQWRDWKVLGRSLPMT